MGDQPIKLLERVDETDPEVVERCENLLAMARRGEIRSLSWVAVGFDHASTRCTLVLNTGDTAILHAELGLQQQFLLQERLSHQADSFDVPALDDDDPDLIDEDPPPDRCPCGGIILADTDEWKVPRCFDCWDRMGQPDEEPER